MYEEGMTPEGIYDLAGNVHEWTRDPYVPYDMQDGADIQPCTPLCAVRGGGWESPPPELRCSHRKGLFPEARLATVGFRCVVPAKPRQPK